MTYTPGLLVTTETEAVAAILAAGGEPPVDDVAVSTRPDVQAAQGLLRAATRELQAEGWTFNTEFGFELLPAATMQWTDTWSQTATTLNVFTPPVNLLSFQVTKAPFQQGAQFLDTVVRPSRLYLGGGTKVFYDRALNRDGHVRSSIYIDPVWLFAFEDLPQAARDVAFLRASRRYLRQVVGDASQDGSIQQDEMVALRNLKRDFGSTDDLNVFRNFDVARHRGGRLGAISAVIDPRYSAGPQ